MRLLVKSLRGPVHVNLDPLPVPLHNLPAPLNDPRPKLPTPLSDPRPEGLAWSLHDGHLLSQHAWGCLPPATCGARPVRPITGSVHHVTLVRKNWQWISRIHLPSFSGAEPSFPLSLLTDLLTTDLGDLGGTEPPSASLVMNKSVRAWQRCASMIMPDACPSCDSDEQLARKRRLIRGSVKPSAQPTLVRTQHLPPPAKRPVSWDFSHLAARAHLSRRVRPSPARSGSLR
jgi:hypothetical protein